MVDRPPGTPSAPTFLWGAQGTSGNGGMSWIRLSKHHHSLLTARTAQRLFPRGQGLRPQAQLTSIRPFLSYNSFPPQQDANFTCSFFPPCTNYCKSWQSKYSHSLRSRCRGHAAPTFSGCLSSHLLLLLSFLFSHPCFLPDTPALCLPVSPGLSCFSGSKESSKSKA